MTDTSTTSEEYRRVSEEALRAIFNDERFKERLEAGELTAQVRPDSLHLKGRLARARREPRCTRSQMAEYFDESGRKVAIVHQYRRRDGSIGGKGRPDPKWLRVGSQIWTLQD